MLAPDEPVKHGPRHALKPKPAKWRRHYASRAASAARAKATKANAAWFDAAYSKKPTAS